MCVNLVLPSVYMASNTRTQETISSNNRPISSQAERDLKLHAELQCIALKELVSLVKWKPL